MVRYARNLALATLTVIVIAPSLAFAAWTDPIVSCIDVACTVCDIAKTAQNLLNTAIYIAVFMSSILFAYAGFIYITNIANHGEITKARNIFANVIIGLVIILASWLVIDTLMKTLVNNDESRFGPWNRVC